MRNSRRSSSSSSSSSSSNRNRICSSFSHPKRTNKMRSNNYRSNSSNTQSILTITITIIINKLLNIIIIKKNLVSQLGLQLGSLRNNIKEKVKKTKFINLNTHLYKQSLHKHIRLHLYSHLW